MILVAKLAIPLAMATVGVGAAAAAVVTNEPATQVSTAAQVWIDAPTGEEPVAPGTIHVGSHATAEGSIGALELYVDGKKVASDSTLERNEKLVYGTFEWKATEGDHELVVAQPGSDRRSTPVELLVTSDAPATTTSSTTSTTGPGSTTTTTGSTTTTTTPGETTSTTPPPMVTAPGETTPPATVAPTSPPVTTPPTTPPAPAPVIDSASLSGTVVYRVDCGYPDVIVSARIRNATSATIIFGGTGFTRAMSRSSSTYTATIPSGLWGTGDVGFHQVTVQASGPGGTTSAVAGNVEIKMNCPKD